MTKTEKTMARLAELRAAKAAKAAAAPPAPKRARRNPVGPSYEEQVAGECFQDKYDMYMNEY